MRFRATLTAFLAASSAMAADLDCTSLKTTRLPFAFLQTASTIRFAGTVATEAQGSKFDAVRVMRTNDGTLQGKPSANRSEVWTSPDLQVNLFNRSNAGGFSSTYLARGITTRFQRAE